MIMKNKNTEIQLQKISQETLIQFLNKVQRRIVIAKAGYQPEEIKQLIELVNSRRIQCDVYIESSENAIRYGFGKQEAMELLNDNIEIFNIQSVNQIRMAFVIVDDNILVYVPLALSWEKEPNILEFPNGLIGGENLTKNLLNQIDGEKSEVKIEGLPIILDSCPIIQKTKTEVKKELSITLKKLEENPPVDPATLRKTNIYRNKFKLLKMTVKGVNIKNKTVSLRPFNSIIKTTDDRLRSSWRALTSDDVKNLKGIQIFQKEKNKILEEFTFDANRFGTLIEVKKKKEFEKGICAQIEKLKKTLLNLNHENNKNIDETKSLIEILELSRNALQEYMIGLSLRNESCWNKLFLFNQYLLKQINNNEMSKENACKEVIESFIDIKLQFPDAEKMIETIDVEFDYYDVSDELLNKDDFKELIKKYEVKIREYNRAYEKQES